LIRGKGANEQRPFVTGAKLILRNLVIKSKPAQRISQQFGFRMLCAHSPPVRLIQHHGEINDFTP
jgi:hypothetical protein